MQRYFKYLLTQEPIYGGGGFSKYSFLGETGASLKVWGKQLAAVSTDFINAL